MAFKPKHNATALLIEMAIFWPFNIWELTYCMGVRAQQYYLNVVV